MVHKQFTISAAEITIPYLGIQLVIPPKSKQPFKQLIRGTAMCGTLQNIMINGKTKQQSSMTTFLDSTLALCPLQIQAKVGNI